MRLPCPRLLVDVDGGLATDVRLPGSRVAAAGWTVEELRAALAASPTTADAPDPGSPGEAVALGAQAYDTLGTLIGIAEVAAAVGLIIGLRKPIIGAAAATGIIALMIGAMIYHVRAQDWAGLAAPIILGLLASTRRAARARPGEGEGGDPEQLSRLVDEKSACP